MKQDELCGNFGYIRKVYEAFVLATSEAQQCLRYFIRFLFPYLPPLWREPLPSLLILACSLPLFLSSTFSTNDHVNLNVNYGIFANPSSMCDRV